MMKTVNHTIANPLETSPNCHYDVVAIRFFLTFLLLLGDQPNGLARRIA